MKKLALRTRQILLGAVALLLPFGARTAQAQQKAYWVPVSDTIVRMEVLVPEGRWISIAVQEGDEARITDNDRHLTMAFVPIIDAEKVRVRAFRIESHEKWSESAHWVEDVAAALGETMGTKKTDLPYSIKVIGISKPSSLRNQGAANPGNSAAGDSSRP